MVTRAAPNRNPQPSSNRWAGRVAVEELSLSPDPNGKTLAEAAVRIGETLTLRHLRVMSGDRGPWLALPAKKQGEDGPWIKTIEIVDRDLGDEVRAVVLAEFEKYRDGIAAPDGHEEDIPW